MRKIKKSWAKLLSQFVGNFIHFSQCEEIFKIQAFCVKMQWIKDQVIHQRLRTNWNYDGLQ